MKFDEITFQDPKNSVEVQKIRKKLGWYKDDLVDTQNAAKLASNCKTRSRYSRERAPGASKIWDQKHL